MRENTEVASNVQIVGGNVKTKLTLFLGDKQTNVQI